MKKGLCKIRHQHKQQQHLFYLRSYYSLVCSGSTLRLRLGQEDFKRSLQSTATTAAAARTSTSPPRCKTNTRFAVKTLEMMLKKLGGSFLLLFSSTRTIQLTLCSSSSFGIGSLKSLFRVNSVLGWSYCGKKNHRHA